jgi:uncharacterized protein YcsI (UPF0317 family)
MIKLNQIQPKEIRKAISKGEFTSQTSGLCPGKAQANIVILPELLAKDFMIFAHNNPKACPVLEVLDPGQRTLKKTASGDDIAKVISKYRVYYEGVLAEEPIDIEHLWKDDFVTFVIGCSFTFESALIDEGIQLRHITQSKNVAMYITNIPTVPSEKFNGPLVVSMRPIKKKDVEKVIEITAKFPHVHGTPVHIGHPEDIGIEDILHPDFGDSVEIMTDEVPVFWACGVTPQAAAMQIKPPVMITHSPGHMLIMDLDNNQLETLLSEE